MSAYQLLVSSDENVKRVALLQNGVVLEYHQEAAEAEKVVGSIFLGRVERVLPDVRAAFVKIGLKLNGFLPLQESPSYHHTSGSASLMSGQEILVQAKKAPKGGKGAFLTRDIALAGQYLLLMPCNRFIGVSKRVENAEDRERARFMGERVADGRFGVIVRHAALFASDANVREEAETLWAEWLVLSQSARNRKAPALLRSEPDMAQILERDYGARHEIEKADETQWERMQVEKQLRAALERRVELSDGGSLMIDEREALHTIDVNSGRTVTAENGQSLPLQENLRAVPEIARQIRLRNLSGIILIDFIDMASEQEREQVLRAMQEALGDDRVKNVIHGFTCLGLLEMTRKRTDESLRDLLTKPCGACRESGRVFHG